MVRNRSLAGPLVLIGLGLLLLYSSVRSNWSPWEVIWRYWPVLLIAWGLGKIWDHMRARDSGGLGAPVRFSGGELGMAVALILLVALALIHHPSSQPEGNYRFTQTVAQQGAKSVRAEISVGAGALDVNGGATQLLDADCYYGYPYDKPEVSYSVAGSEGELKIQQPGTEHIHFGGDRTQWNLRLSDQVPLDLTVAMGAGTGRLQLAGLQLTHLRVDGGVGTVTVDLGGDWKQSFDGHISGGVGTVTVRLPTSVGVHIHATGGIGSVNAPGFERDGDAYVNSAYGKSPVTINLEVEGGIGSINLESAS